ncbi:MAG: hypothetical protein NTZ67_05250 [Gammaproteobacteria bacterium]|nr:hypothetical protein [Gammaproteobacteria bacterium]
MRMTQYIYKRLQEEFPELFVAPETSGEVSSLFSAFLPEVALSNSSQNPWGQYGNRAVPLKRKTILLSFDGLENLPFSALNHIDRLVCFLKRAGFVVLLSVGNTLEEYDLQLFNREEIKKVSCLSRSALSQMAMDQRKVKADDIFFIDDIKIQSDCDYIQKFNLNILEIEGESVRESYKMTESSDQIPEEGETDGAYSLVLTVNVPLQIEDFISEHINAAYIKVNFDNKVVYNQKIPMLKNLYYLGLNSKYYLQNILMFKPSLTHLEILHSENYRNVFALQANSEEIVFPELRELTINEKCAEMIRTPLILNAPKLSYLYLKVRFLGETIDLRLLKSLTSLEIDYSNFPRSKLDTLVTFLTEVNPNLIELRVTGEVTTLGTLLPVIEKTPNLRNLKLDETCVVENEIHEISKKYPDLIISIHYSVNFRGSRTKNKINGARLIDRQHNPEFPGASASSLTSVMEKEKRENNKEISGKGKEDNFVYQTESDLKLDFDTQHDQTLTHIMRPACKHLTKNFPSHFAYTRDSVYFLNNDIEKEEMKEKVLESYIIPQKNKNSVLDLYEFNQKINVRCNEEIKLKSLSTKDRLIDLCLNGKTLTSDDVEVLYDDLGFYHVKFLKQLNGQLSYAIDVSTAPVHIPQDLPEKLMLYINNIKSFPSFGVEPLSGILITKKRKLMAMYHQKKASCRHRVPVLLYLFSELKKEYPIDYKNIQIRGAARGGVHENIEISVDDGKTWCEEDLGGFETKTEYLSPVLLPISFSAKSEVQHDTFFEVLGKINSDPGKNIFLCLNESDDIYRCVLQIKHTCLKRPVFYIHSPDDLQTSVKVISINASRTECLVTSAGNLERFLIENEHKIPVIVVNWENFSPLNILKVNSIITNSNRKIGNIFISSNVTVVGLHSKNEKLADLLLDTSFVSRHASGGVRDFSSNKIPAIQVREEACSHEIILKINLHCSSRWRDILIGKVVLDQDRLIWRDGLLFEAYENTDINAIELINPPTSSPEFQNFVSDLRLGEAFFALNQSIKIKQKMKIKIIESALFFNSKNINFLSVDIVPEKMIMINQYTFELCLHNKKITEIGLLKSENGLIALRKGGSLELCLCESLTQSQWSLLLAELEKHNVMLTLYFLPDAKIPRIMNSDIKVIEIKNKSSCENHFIISNNISKTVSGLRSQFGNVKVIDISEMSVDDLLCRITFTKCNDKFRFQKKMSAVWNALREGGTVILKGRISNEIFSCLASFFSTTPYFMLEGIVYQFKGKLIIVSDATFSPPYWLNVKKKDEPEFIKINIPHIETKEIDPGDLSLFACETFEENRLNSILSILTVSPYVVLEGSPGVGKSYFIRELERKSNVKIYREKDINLWATDNFPGLKILFRDEINLRNTDCSQDSDLLNDPPSIYIGGEYFPLGENCKIMYTQNPIVVGGVRSEQKLFGLFLGVKCQFEEMSGAFMLHRILTPILETTFEPAVSALRAKNILMNSGNSRSIRDLQLKAIVACVTERYPVPAYPPVNTAQVCIDTNGFILTASRFDQHAAMHELLNSRIYKRELPDSAPDAAKYGGNNGMILQGPAGVGKSDFFLKELLSAGYVNGNLPVKAPAEIEARNHGKIYYCLPPESDEEAILGFLDKAFHEGAILLFDEIDSCPLEKIFNAYLTGEDLNGGRPTQAGFMLFCTANGAHNKGRGILTEAFLSRFVVKVFGEYARDELIQILEAKYIPPGLGVKYLQECIVMKKIINFVVDEFLTQQNKKEFDSPPTFRDLENFCSTFFESTYPLFRATLSFEQYQFMLSYRNHPRMKIITEHLLSGVINARETSVAALVEKLKTSGGACSLFSPRDNANNNDHFIGPSYSA